MFVMGVLFLSETVAFWRTEVSTSITLDENTSPQIRLNFNITIMDLHCDYVSVDVWDALGTNRQNVTKNIDKWQLDDAGVRRIFAGRNREGRELSHDEHSEKNIQDVHEEHGGEMAPHLTDETFDEFVKAHEMAFVDLYAPW